MWMLHLVSLQWEVEVVCDWQCMILIGCTLCVTDGPVNQSPESVGSLQTKILSFRTNVPPSPFSTVKLSTSDFGLQRLLAAAESPSLRARV